MVRRGRIGKLEYATHMSPSVIRYTQDSIKSEFLNGQSLEDTLKEILHSGKSPEDIEVICVVWYNSNYYAISGNRRLYLYKLLQSRCLISTIPVEVVTVTEEVFYQYYTTNNEGLSVRLRGGAQREREIHQVLRQFMTERRKVRKKQAKQAAISDQHTNQYRNPAISDQQIDLHVNPSISDQHINQHRNPSISDQHTNKYGNPAIISSDRNTLSSISQQHRHRQTQFQNPTVRVQQPSISASSHYFSDIDIDRTTPPVSVDHWRRENQQNMESEENSQQCCLLACILRIFGRSRDSMNQPITA